MNKPIRPDYDVIVVGGGHAGIEASLAPKRMGLRVAMFVLDPHNIGSMPCNPSIGGPAKGVVTREIDALGGEQGKAADATQLQMKMLNLSKGPGVWALRSQNDKLAYREYMRSAVIDSGVDIVAEEVVDLLLDGDKVIGVVTTAGQRTAKAVILTTGTYLRSITMRGADLKSEGPDKQKAANRLGERLSALGYETLRLKTGTPPRIYRDTIDYSVMEVHPGTEGELAFSRTTRRFVPLAEQMPCYMIHTNEKTHAAVRQNIARSPMYGGAPRGTGARYCPSIEDKVMRFADKPRHQIFIEPESRGLDTMYLGGFSSSMPEDVQDVMIRSLPGLAKCKVAKYAYAIEYDAINPVQLRSTLESKLHSGLYFAGQINGTSGYEEAACQGLMAGINAALKIKGRPALVLGRHEAYIGVLIDDLTTKGVTEPYRLLTSRAEHRLLLRNDNAEERLLAYGHAAGLVSDEDFSAFEERSCRIEQARKALSEHVVSVKSDLGRSLSLAGPSTAFDCLRRPGVSFADVASFLPVDLALDERSQKSLEIAAKYEGYIKSQQAAAESLARGDGFAIPDDTDYQTVVNLSAESREKLSKVRPETIGQASRISGVTPADLVHLMTHIKRARRPSAGDRSSA